MTSKFSERPDSRKWKTGSCFDATNFVIRRAGAHHIAESKIPDISAFSISRPPSRSSPKEFLRKHTGMGGCKAIKSTKKIKTTSLPILKGPRSAGAHRIRANPPNTDFRRYYERGDLPLQICHFGVRSKIQWKTHISNLDYNHFLPIFFDGLREKEEPYKFLAEQGVLDMLQAGEENMILPVIPQLIIPMKTALNTRDADVIVIVLKTLQQLVNSGKVIGVALVPYYRQLLPILNIFKHFNRNIGDAMDYAQKDNNNVGDLIHSTLELLERSGGPHAFINIKSMIPTYESCVIKGRTATIRSTGSLMNH